MQETFLWSLVATDVCSGWTEAVPLVAREQFLVIEGLAVMRRQFPVPIRGIDTDNDSAFITGTLQGYCQEQQRLLAELHHSRAARIQVAGVGVGGDAPDAQASGTGRACGRKK